MSYNPKPIDTTNVQLCGDVAELVERLARNTHDVWGETRLAQGWRYGEKRDDEKREHPCLVDYEHLSESERLVDRNTAEQVLKSIVALGYSIRNDGAA